MDGRDNTLHEFEFWNVPVVNHFSLSLSPPSSYDGHLIVMEDSKGCKECSAIIAIELRILRKVTEVHK